MTAVFFAAAAFSQAKISMATDLAVVHSFKKEQRFYAVGQTIIAQFHVDERNGAYLWYGYTGTGKFNNDLLATAKSPVTSPAEIHFKSAAEIRLRHISIGWKHYLKGSSYAETSWNLYFTTGFGLVFGRANNNYNTSIDTSIYDPPANPVNGSGKFRRLSFDAAIGYEVPIGMDIYFYGEAKAFIPTTDYPSKYLFVNDNAPLVGSVNLGLRVLF